MPASLPYVTPLIVTDRLSVEMLALAVFRAHVPVRGGVTLVVDTGEPVRVAPDGADVSTLTVRVLAFAERPSLCWPAAKGPVDMVIVPAAATMGDC
jgi:hypothetical protein